MAASASHSSAGNDKNTVRKFVEDVKHPVSQPALETTKVCIFINKVIFFPVSPNFRARHIGAARDSQCCFVRAPQFRQMGVIRIRGIT